MKSWFFSCFVATVFLFVGACSVKDPDVVAPLFYLMRELPNSEPIPFVEAGSWKCFGWKEEKLCN